ncbi:MAG: hypothetical protein ACOYB3_05500 [Azonexus sp.]
MKRLRERRATRLAECLPSDLPGLSGGELLDLLNGAYRAGYIGDFEAAAAELAQRLRAKRAGSHSVTVTGQEADDGATT